MQMTQSEIIRKFHAFTPSTPFGQMLSQEFGVDVPHSAPKYMQEYLYKHCVVERNKGTVDVVKVAAEKVEEFLKKFPWVSAKYDETEAVVSASKNDSPSKVSYVMKEAAQIGRGRGRGLRVPKDIADGTIEFYEVKSVFQLYIGGKPITISKSIESLKDIAKRKHGITVFGGIYTFSGCVATAYKG